MEPRLTATSVIRSPRYYGHFFWSPGKNNHTFSCKETLVNTVSSLSRPNFFGPLVTVLTGVPLYEADHSSFFWWLAATWFVARQVWTWVVKRPTSLSTRFAALFCKTSCMYLLPVLSYLELSPPQRPLCVVGRLGRQKKTARGARWKKMPLPSSHRPPRAFYFLIIGSLCGGESTLGEQCIYLNYMSEQRGILSGHVLYRAAFISSRWHAPSRCECASASRSFWAKPFTLTTYLLFQVPPWCQTEWFFWVPNFLTKKSGQTTTYSSEYHLQMIIRFHFNLRFTFQTRQIVGLNNRRNTRSEAMFTL